MAGVAFNSFYEHFKKVGIRTSIEGTLRINSGIAEVDEFLKNIHMYFKSWQIPTRQTEYKTVNFKGIPFQQPVSMKFGQEGSFDCICDLSMYAHSAFTIWSNHVFDGDIDSGSILGGNKRFTSSTIFMDTLSDDMETVLHTYKLSGVNIKNVGAVTFNNDQADISYFKVDLNWQWWNIVGGEGADVLSIG